MGLDPKFNEVRESHASDLSTSTMSPLELTASPKGTQLGLELGLAYHTHQLDPSYDP